MSAWHHLCGEILKAVPEVSVEEAEAYLRPWMVAIVKREFAEANTYLELTEEAMYRSGIIDDPPTAAREAYDYYISSQFFDRLLLSTNSAAASRQAAAITNLTALDPLAETDQPVVIAAFHQSRYLMFSVGMFVHPMRVVGLKARRDIIEKFGQVEHSKGQTVYTVDRSTPMHMMRALAKGHHVSMMIDHVHPLGEVHTVEFLGQPINVNLGAAWLAHNSKCPLVPMGMHQHDGRYVATLYPPVTPGSSVYETIQRLYTSLELAVRREPRSWSRWFTAFSDKREIEVRPRLRQANNDIWNGITSAMGLQ